MGLVKVTTVAMAAALCTVIAMARDESGATADLLDSQGKSVGRATFSEGADGVRIQAKLSGLPAGVHAMHIHNVGQCHAPDFKSAGDHFNPFNKKHGLKHVDGPHAGDLPNFEVKTDGTAEIDVHAGLVTLKDGKNSLLQRGGTCLMIHAKADDGVSDPAGDAGPRIACGEIRKP